MESLRAESVYSVTLEPAVGAQFPHPRWFKALGLAAGYHLGVWDGPSAGEMVIIRKGGSTEVVHRQPAGDHESMAFLMDHIQNQLRELDVESFEVAWSLPPTDDPS